MSMIIRLASSILTCTGMMFVVAVAREHGDWKIFAAACVFGIGGFLCGVSD